ncbi:MAG: MOSC domain-containing protein [Deltaproteobacteria bacterium]|nr:MOSC domain-containing protein [Deltaproteobacteria bacterium]
MSGQGVILATCIGESRGAPKRAVSSVRLVRGHGLEGDAHAGNWHRQVSMLADEEIAKVRSAGLVVEPGAFGENMITSGVDFAELAVGRRFRVGQQAVLQITQRGKECHSPCSIYERLGDCLMPREGLFARVRRGGRIGPGDAVCLDPDLDRVRWAVCTISDRSASGERQDESGLAVRGLLEGCLGSGLVSHAVLADEQDAIGNELRRLCDEEVCDIVVTTGGTGLAPRDVTPEATLAVVERPIPGMAEAIRAAGLAHTPHAMLSRAVCGLRGQTLIVNLSGSPSAAREQLAVILPVLPHAIATASGIPNDCGRPAPRHEER